MPETRFWTLERWNEVIDCGKWDPQYDWASPTFRDLLPGDIIRIGDRTERLDKFEREAIDKARNDEHIASLKAELARLEGTASEDVPPPAPEPPF